MGLRRRRRSSKSMRGPASEGLSSVPQIRARGGVVGCFRLGCLHRDHRRLHAPHDRVRKCAVCRSAGFLLRQQALVLRILRCTASTRRGDPVPIAVCVQLCRRDLAFLFVDVSEPRALLGQTRGGQHMFFLEFRCHAILGLSPSSAIPTRQLRTTALRAETFDQWNRLR